MQVVWNEAKRRRNLKKHRLDFADAESVFDGITLTFEDDRVDYGEQGFITIGMLHGEFVVIAHSEQNDQTRVISMRKATKHEEQGFYNSFGD